MSTSISKHNCAGVRLEKFMPENGNCIIFVIDTGSGYRENLDITLFGLSTKKAERLVAAIKEIEEMGDE
jgi:hypothetical protein